MSEIICDVEKFRNGMVFVARVHVTARTDRGAGSICTKVGMAVPAGKKSLSGSCEVLYCEKWSKYRDLSCLMCVQGCSKPEGRQGSLVKSGIAGRA